MRLNLRIVSDDIIEILTDTVWTAHRLAANLRDEPVFEEAVAGFECVAVRFDPTEVALQTALSLLERKVAGFNEDAHKEPTHAGEPLEIPVAYGGRYGCDFDDICGTLQLSREEFIAEHTNALHTVELVGFTPGFAYIRGEGLFPDLQRKATPRSQVEAGSIGLAQGYTGVYALAGPGGWPIIGRTDAKLFVPDDPNPVRLRPGVQIRFKAV